MTEVADLRTETEGPGTEQDRPSPMPAEPATTRSTPATAQLPNDGSSSGKGIEGPPWRLASRGRGGRLSRTLGVPRGSGSHPRRLPGRNTHTFTTCCVWVHSPLRCAEEIDAALLRYFESRFFEVCTFHHMSFLADTHCGPDAEVRALELGGA